MGTLAHDNENVHSEEYVSLGLKESSIGNSGNPQVLSLFSTLLERAVQKNERILEATKMKDDITIFHGSRAPSLSICQYIDRIFKYSSCSPSCFVIAHIYVDRFVQRTNMFLTSLNIHRVIITSVMVAAKFIDDAFFNNAYYARVGGVSTAELNKLEMKFLFGLDFELHVTLQTFKRYCSRLAKEAIDVLQIERSSQACGVKKSWQNKDDSTYAPTIAR
ncbi:cyclin-P3-1-like [Olea europaea var. sylvestris]|uniref:Cyclin n=1 Tax=Olea europaea subsp. europaea TaxID=158383 RepID=A0A8S0TS14_OLEEU|nr:cyclin-P3-1-like [Olea europaea var. sylvestris]CAA3008776.1 cyclin-P3-1 [Olea europaea subsp. europaea]